MRQEPPTLTQYRSHRLRRLPRLGLAAAIALGAVSGAALWQYQESQRAHARAERAEARAAGLSAVLAAPDTRISSRKMHGGGTGTVIVSKQRDRAAFLSSGLPALPDGKVYQLWFADAGTMRSAGIIDDATRDGTVLMDGPVRSASGVGLTVEPAGGSPSPTSDPLVVMAFPA
ncbi:anti-sigma factor [Streptomyces sp. NPDC006678]|uniref:anti-sigma factor n=1 Tax=Streptomyces sp. NPDC006678 TaxID=3157185 RepID=UPI0033E7E8EA